MKVYLPGEIGFCFGVEKAIHMVEQELQKKSEQVYCLGDLIHNPEVMRSLKKRGLKVISDLRQIKEGTVFTRAHGIDKKILEEENRRGLRIIETTCPYVLRVQKIAQELSAQSYHIVVVGSAKHPEIKAVVSNTPTQKLSVIQTIKEMEKIPAVKKIGMVAQTTESLDNFKNIMKNLIENRLEIRVFNTICKIVRERQQEAVQLAKKVDSMVVVGGSNSSNTKRLAELCHSQGVKTYFIEKAEDLDLNDEKIKNIRTIGITGGTSTPGETIKALKRKLNKLN